MCKVYTTLHLLLDIYKVVARTYQLGLQQLTKYLAEKQQRNQIFYCNRAIQEYTYNVTGNYFSFVNFINSPEQKLSPERSLMMQTICKFQRRSRDKR